MVDIGWVSVSDVVLSAYGKTFPARSNPAIIVGCEVAGVIGHACVVTACCRLEVGCCEEIFVSEHSARDIMGELLDLFACIF